MENTYCVSANEMGFRALTIASIDCNLGMRKVALVYILFFARIN